MIIMLNIAMVIFVSIFGFFILFLIFYGILCKNRKIQKVNIINYEKKLSTIWSNNINTTRSYSIEDLHSPIKMYNTGIGNTGYNLVINNYTSNTQWLIKM